MKPKLRLIAEREPERIYGSEKFIARTRNTKLKSPTRFEPTIKADGDIVI